MSLYKFTYIPLLKNNVILKQKCYKQPQKNAINQKKIIPRKKKNLRLVKSKKKKRKAKQSTITPLEAPKKKKKRKGKHAHCRGK